MCGTSRQPLLQLRWLNENSATHPLARPIVPLSGTLVELGSNRAPVVTPPATTECGAGCAAAAVAMTGGGQAAAQQGEGLVPESPTPAPAPVASDEQNKSGKRFLRAQGHSLSPSQSESASPHHYPQKLCMPEHPRITFAMGAHHFPALNGVSCSCRLLL